MDSSSTFRLRAVGASRYIAQFTDPLYGHYPSILPGAAKPLYLAGSARPMWVRTLAGGKAVYMGYNSVRSPSPSFLRKLGRLARAPSTKRVDRGRAPQRRWRQHDVWTAHHAVRLESGEQARQALSPHGPRDLLGRRELRRGDRSRHASDHRRGADGWWRRDVRRHVSRRPARRRAGRFTSLRGTTSARKGRATGGSRSRRICPSTSRQRSTSRAEIPCWSARCAVSDPPIRG